MTTCTAEKHGTFNAIKLHHCTCPGEQQDAYEAYRLRQNEARKRRYRRTEASSLEEVVDEPAFDAPAVPEPTHAATQLQWFLHSQDGLPCRERPDVFHGPGLDGPVGDDLRIARRLCGSCLFEDDCLTVALIQADDWSFAGGTLPSQRRHIRALLPSGRRKAAA